VETRFRADDERFSPVREMTRDESKAIIEVTCLGVPFGTLAVPAEKLDSPG
jgi:hypothetical protein